jgi:hypothetical protein
VSGYTKLFSSILNSTVWVGQTPATKLVWITMMALADRDGIVTASVAGLAKLAEVPRAECERALELFLAPDPDSSSREHDGRRIEAVDRGWRLLNHAKYRDLQGREDQLARHRERQKRYRDRQSVSGARDGERDVTVTGVTAMTPGDPIRSDPSPAPDPSPEVEEGTEAAQPPSAPPAAVLLKLPCRPGKIKRPDEWPLTEREVALLSDAFPGVDVVATAKQMRVWLVSTPQKRKTYDGMLNALRSWIASDVNRGKAILVGQSTGNQQPQYRKLANFVPRPFPSAASDRREPPPLPTTVDLRR